MGAELAYRLLPFFNRRVRWTQATLIAAVAAGVAIGLGSYTFVSARGYSYLTDDPGGLRQLPYHARSLRRVDAHQPSVRGDVQRLPHAAGHPPEVRDEGAQRLLAFLLFHEILGISSRPLRHRRQRRKVGRLSCPSPTRRGMR
jgi:hypothetical protein